MNAWQIATIAVLVLAVALAWLRLGRQPGVGPRWRRGALLLLQPACALALYLLLYPPLQRVEGGTLVVLTAGAPADAIRPGREVVALPEAGIRANALAVPDLASALRQRPDTARLQILGQGLPARDREAVGGRPLAFTPAAPLPGLVELATPAPVAPGNDFAVLGEVAGVPGARIELLDPAGRRVDATSADARGRFALNGHAGIAGEVLFAVRVLDAKGTERDRQPLPLRVIAAPALRVWVLAGAPQPEWKFLRRWAADAGASLHTQIAVGGGLQLGDAPMPLDAATLDGFDLLWLDERALAALSRAQRDAILAAARRGLGVLVRLDGPLDATGRQALAQWGLPMRGGDDSMPLAWPTAAGEDMASAGPSRRDFAPTRPAQVLAHDAKGVAYAWWRAQGQGRIGVTTLADSYRLPLAGASAAHARLWSSILSRLARPDRATAPAISLPALAWAGARTSLCGLATDAVVRDPTGRAHAVVVDPATGRRACGGYWPMQAGWHVLVSGGGQHPFYVRDPNQARAWFQHAEAEATTRLVRGESAAAAPATAIWPGSRWPAWWAFVLLAATCAWLERPRRA